MKLDTFKESLAIYKSIERGEHLDVIWPRWIKLKNQLKRRMSYVSKNNRENIYGCSDRVSQINNREDLSYLIFYYSDRWHACRVYTFDEAFKKLMKERNE